MKITINKKEIEVKPGETLIEVARRQGYEVPSLCYSKGAVHRSSCMICAVKDSVTGQIIPSCTTLPTEGMQIDTESEEVNRIRTMSLELLLSDHRADCEGPCKTGCPAGFDIARMNRLYDEREYGRGLEFLRDALVIPATLCYICNAPCEKICRRNEIDHPVAIRKIKKELVSKTQLDDIARPKSNGTKVIITGSGPAGLSAAYHLCKRGYEVNVLEEGPAILTPHIKAGEVPADILELEIGVLERMGITFLTACPAPIPGMFDVGISTTGTEISYPGWISLTTKVKQPARLVLEGRKLAEQLHTILSGKPGEVKEERKPFNSTYTRFREVEKGTLRQQMKETTYPSGCLYCDCDMKTNCKLRTYATQYNIRTIQYARDNNSIAMRRTRIQFGLCFEDAKCIRCGLCVYNSKNGFTFKDRGFGMQVVIPEENKKNIKTDIINLCPTGALYLKD